MTRKKLVALNCITTTLAIAPAPLLAEPSTGPTRAADPKVQPVGRMFEVPGYGTDYVVPLQPKDTRTPRQRCVDEEVAQEGGSPSELTLGAIDLKCSRR
jgi:hypothetical protein